MSALLYLLRHIRRDQRATICSARHNQPRGFYAGSGYRAAGCWPADESYSGLCRQGGVRVSAVKGTTSCVPVSERVAIRDSHAYPIVHRCSPNPATRWKSCCSEQQVSLPVILRQQWVEWVGVPGLLSRMCSQPAETDNPLNDEMGEDQYENITVQQKLAPPNTEFLASLLSLRQVKMAITPLLFPSCCPCECFKSSHTAYWQYSSNILCCYPSTPHHIARAESTC